MAARPSVRERVCERERELSELRAQQLASEPRRGDRMSSSPPKIGEDSAGGSNAAERVIANAGTVELPVLTRTNYHEWSLVMKVGPQALGLWHTVSTDKVERRDDRLALAAILRGVPSELKAGLAVKETAKEAWAAVKMIRVGEDRVKAANKQCLMKEFENVGFRDGE